MSIAIASLYEYPKRSVDHLYPFTAKICICKATSSRQPQKVDISLFIFMVLFIFILGIPHNLFQEVKNWPHIHIWSILVVEGQSTDTVHSAASLQIHSYVVMQTGQHRS